MAIPAAVRRIVDRTALAVMMGVWAASAAKAGDAWQPQRDTFGEIGLLDMPSAHMAPDGELALSVAAMDDARRVALSFQILPWLEGSFRYSDVLHWNNQKNYYDRSFGLKLRLFEETAYTPDLSVGVRDLVGTGVYGSEYLAASKRIGDFDLTAGLGWGRLASNETFGNPFGDIFRSFDVRHLPGTTGRVDFGQFFHGPNMGLFGGAVWHTPIDNLSVTLEYSSDRYVRETFFHGFKTKSPVNVGLTYYPLDYLQITGGWFYGDTFGGVMTMSVDPTRPAAPIKVDTAPLPAILRADGDRADAVAGLVEQATGLGFPAPGARRAAEQNDAPNSHQSLFAALAGAPGQAKSIEIDRGTLIANVHAHRDGEKYCKTYAQLAAASRADIRLVAITDLDRADNKIAICAVEGAPDDSHLLQTVAITDGDDEESGSTPAPNMQPGSFDPDAVKRKIIADANAQSLRVEAVSFGRSEMIIYYDNTAYEFEDTAIGRLSRVLMADAPPNIEVFRIITVLFDRPVREVRVLRAPLERVFSTRGALSDIPGAVSVRGAPMDNPVLEQGRDGTFPRFSWALSPSIRQGLFDPSAPLRVQAYADASGSVDVMPGLALEGAFEGNIYSTFSGKIPSKSALPHVRSNIAQYLTKGRNGIADLDVAFRTRITPDVFVEAKAGYLESMFGGAGAQILWRPDGERWAFGADVYDVWQRNFDRLFGFQHYNIVTGHVSVYYQSPWYGLNFEGHFGRYLAGDYGTTLEITRSFDTGVSVGAFATFTNVPFEKFGEGSFDKGIVLHIPLEWALPFSSQSEYNFVLTPLTRDGGQRLMNDDSLYGETKRTSYGELAGHEDSIANP